MHLIEKIRAALDEEERVALAGLREILDEHEHHSWEGNQLRDAGFGCWKCAMEPNIGVVMNDGWCKTVQAIAKMYRIEVDA